MGNIADYVDALDHIMRVARKSRTQSRRLRWIEARARCALEGGEDWKDLDLPKFSESSQRYLQARIAELEQQLAAVRTELARVRAALTHIKRVMGPKVPPCCDGCAAEWQETLDTANTALAAGGDA